MLKVAITGNIASGKSTVEQILREKGYHVLDTDLVAHELCRDESVKTELISAFSDYDITEKIGNSLEISRQKLGAVVFENENERKKLESILHPKIKEEIGRFFRRYESEKIAFVSVPLLFEAKFETLFDKIILVFANDDTRMQRLINRNNLTKEHAKNRVKIQISQDKKIPLADFIIHNDKSINDLHEQVEKILNSL